jgi:hypothetical protein
MLTVAQKPDNKGFEDPPLGKIADEAGFRFGDKGAHTSRTMMFEELASLLFHAGREATRDDYRYQVLELNCLEKRTAANRRLTLQRLSELYALDPNVLIFRIMRNLWNVDESGRPILALLMSMARDPLLRLTAPPIIQLRSGEELSRQTFISALEQGTGSRFNEATLDKIIRNTASTWTQSGHLSGRCRKVRQAVKPTPSVLTFAMVLGHLQGIRGAGLFSTEWAQVLDLDVDNLIFLAMDAKRLGFLDVKVSGKVVEVSLSRLFVEQKKGARERSMSAPAGGK